MEPSGEPNDFKQEPAAEGDPSSQQQNKQANDPAV